jgi:hypothetical protein
MTDADVALRALTEQVLALKQQVTQQRSEMAQQQEAILQQQAALTALQAQVQVQEVNLVDRQESTHHQQQKNRTSRRRLLASAGAAAATAGVVALGSSNASVAYASGSTPWELGTANTAGSTTNLTSDPAMSPNPLVQLDNHLTAGADGLDSFGGDGGIGVFGEALNSSSAIGVYGASNTGTGVVANSVFSVALTVEGTGRLLQTLQSQVGSPNPSFTYTAGESIRDKNADLWICLASGTPGTWARVPHVVPGATGGATSYLAKPIRLLDTRHGASDALNEPNAPYAGGSTHSLTIAGVSFNSVTVPSSAVGAIGNVTVVAGSGGGGYLALVPHGAGFSGTAILAFSANQIVSNSFNVGLSSGQLDIIIGGNTTDVILDLFAVVA